jgi:hypothetical protein
VAARLDVDRVGYSNVDVNCQSCQKINPKQMKPKEYEIDSFEKLVNVVNRENIQSLTSDITLWLMYVIETYEKIREAHPELKEKTNWDIAKCHFTWVDDNRNDILSTKIVNRETGEVTKIEFK